MDANTLDHLSNVVSQNLECDIEIVKKVLNEIDDLGAFNRLWRPDTLKNKRIELSPTVFVQMPLFVGQVYLDEENLNYSDEDNQIRLTASSRTELLKKVNKYRMHKKAYE